MVRANTFISSHYTRSKLDPQIVRLFKDSLDLRIVVTESNSSNRKATVHHRQTIVMIQCNTPVLRHFNKCFILYRFNFKYPLFFNTLTDFNLQ